MNEFLKIGVKSNNTTTYICKAPIEITGGSLYFGGIIGNEESSNAFAKFFTNQAMSNNIRFALLTSEEAVRFYNLVAVGDLPGSAVGMASGYDDESGALIYAAIQVMDMSTYDNSYTQGETFGLFAYVRNNE